MDKTKWKYFKENNLKHIFRTSSNEWIRELFPFPFLKFLEKTAGGERLYYKIMKTRFLLTRKPVLPIIEYVVTTRCTMNCKHCNTFIPSFNNETHVKPTSFKTFKQDIDKLLKSVDYIENFGFVGGEPLIAKDLAKMVKYAASKRKIHHIFIATNCTILPNKELLKAAKNKKVAFQISDYRNVENIDVKYNEYKELLIKNKIAFNNFQEKREAVTWFSMPECYKDKQENVKQLYDSCFGRYCNMLADGVLTQCTVSIHMYRLMERTPEIEADVVNIREEKSAKKLTEELIGFYARPYSEFCNWCHWENIEYGLPCGEQVLRA